MNKVANTLVVTVLVRMLIVMVLVIRIISMLLVLAMLVMLNMKMVMVVVVVMMLMGKVISLRVNVLNLAMVRMVVDHVGDGYGGNYADNDD